MIEAGWPETESGLQKFREFDEWLRAEGNQRNPGTSADLVAATLYVGFREGVVGSWELGDDLKLNRGREFG